MDKPIKITRLETENIKRVRAVALAPAVNGLTIIGGDNNQGKVSTHLLYLSLDWKTSASSAHISNWAWNACNRQNVTTASLGLRHR